MLALTALQTARRAMACIAQHTGTTSSIRRCDAMACKHLGATARPHTSWFLLVTAYIEYGL